jgi:hypothetical protein
MKQYVNTKDLQIIPKPLQYLTKPEHKSKVNISTPGLQTRPPGYPERLTRSACKGITQILISRCKGTEDSKLQHMCQIQDHPPRVKLMRQQVLRPQRLKFREVWSNLGSQIGLGIFLINLQWRKLRWIRVGNPSIQIRPELYSSMAGFKIHSSEGFKPGQVRFPPISG